MHSIRYRLLALFVVVATVTLAIIGIYGHSRLSRELDASFAQFKASTITRLTISLPPPVSDMNSAMAQSILEAEMQPTELLSIQVFDASGKLFIGTERDKVNRIVSGKKLNVQGGIPVEAPLFRQTGEGAGSAGAEQSGSAIGRVVVHFSRHRVEEALWNDLLRCVLEILFIDAMLIFLLTLGLRMVFGPLGKLRDSLLDLAQNESGEIVELPETKQNEFGEVIRGFNQTLRKLKQVISQSHQAEESTNRLMEIDQAVQTVLTFEEFGNALLARLAQILDLVYGALYIADAEESQLRRVGGYGCDDSIHSRCFAWGQSLVGQAAMNKRQMALSLHGEEPVVVVAKMGLGALKVRTLLISPIVDRDRVLAVLEIGAQEPLESWKTEFIEALLPALATKIQILVGNVGVRELLEQTQAQAEELAASRQQMHARGDEIENSRVILAEAEEALSRANKEQTAIFESLTIGIAFIKDRVILRGNAMLGDLFGRPMDEIIGQTTRVWYQSEEEFLGIGASVYEDLKRQSIHQREQQLQRKDGSLFWCSITVRAMDVEDLSHGIVCTLEDITKRKQTEDALIRANKEQAAIFESLTLGIAFIKDRVILRGNRKLEDLFGRPMDEMIGQTTRIWYQNEEEYLGRGASVYEDLKRQPLHQREQQLQRKDGSLFWCFVSIRAMDPEDLSRGIVCMLEDITERKLAEEVIREVREIT